MRTYVGPRTKLKRAQRREATRRALKLLPSIVDELLVAGIESKGRDMCTPEIAERGDRTTPFQDSASGKLRDAVQTIDQRRECRLRTGCELVHMERGIDAEQRKLLCVVREGHKVWSFRSMNGW